MTQFIYLFILASLCPVFLFAEDFQEKLSPRSVMSEHQEGFIRPIWDSKKSDIVRQLMALPPMDKLPYMVGIVDHDRHITEKEIQDIKERLFRRGIYTVGIEMEAHMNPAEPIDDTYFNILALKLHKAGFKVVPVDDAELVLKQTLHHEMIRMVSIVMEWRETGKSPESTRASMQSHYIAVVDELSMLYKGILPRYILDELFLNEFYNYSNDIAMAKNERELEVIMIKQGHSIFKLNLERSARMFQKSKDFGALISGYGHTQHLVTLGGMEGVPGMAIGDDPQVVDLLKNDIFLHIVADLTATKFALSA